MSNRCSGSEVEGTLSARVRQPGAPCRWRYRAASARRGGRGASTRGKRSDRGRIELRPFTRWGPVEVSDDEIVVVTTRFFPEKIGTAYYVAELVRELSERGERVRVVTTMPYYPQFVRFPGFGRARRHDDFEGTPVHRVPTIVPRQGKPLGRLVSECNLVLQVLLALLTGRLRRRRRVLVVTPGAPLAVVAARMLTRRGGRLVVMVHDVASGLASTTTGSGRAQRVIAAVESWCINRGDVAAVLSQAMGALLTESGVRLPCEVIGLWPTLPMTEVEVGVGSTVLYSGNLGRKQGVAVLLDLAERLSTLAPESRLVVRGRGSQEAVLRDEVARRGISNLRFADLVGEDELAEALRAGDVHVVPQLPDGAESAVPSKIYNILAVGRPIVATASLGSPVALLASETQAITCVDPDDLDGFATAVVSLLHDDQARLGLGRDGQRWVMGHTRSRAADRVLALLNAFEERLSNRI